MSIEEDMESAAWARAAREQIRNFGYACIDAGSIDYNCLDKIMSRIAAPTAQPAAQSAPQGEQQAFEAWARDQGFSLEQTPTSDGESYLDLRTQGPWDAWKARAALAHPPAAQPAAFIWHGLLGHKNLRWERPGKDDIAPTVTPLYAHPSGEGEAPRRARPRASTDMVEFMKWARAERPLLNLRWTGAGFKVPETRTAFKNWIAARTRAPTGE